MATYGGTSGDDSHWGTAASDRIEGQGGRDYLLGEGGDDEIFGGDGDDNLHGGSGSDLLEGGPGDDLLQGNDGADILRGQGGDDRFLLLAYEGSLAGDSVDGGDQADFLQFDGQTLAAAIVFSIANPSVAQSLAGATIVNVEQISFRSGSGNDDITGWEFDDYVDGGDGDDRIDGGLGNDVLDGGTGTDTIYGGGGNDTIYGGVANLLYGGEGDDSFVWGSDALIDGGGGTDGLRVEYYYYGNPPIDLIVDISNPNVETLVLGTRVTGVEYMSFYSGHGNDRLTGGSGNDQLTGNGGNDILVGGLGNDTLSGGDGHDRLSGGGGDDFLHNVTTDSYPDDVFDGGDGFDRLEFRLMNASGSVTIDLLAASGMVTNVEQISFSSFNGTGAHNVSGAGGTDAIWGGGGGDVINGRGGDDDLRGGGGNDVIDGGSGNDFIDGEGGANQLYGGEGNDTVRSYWGDPNYLDGGAGDDLVEGGTAADTLVGGEGDDTLSGSDGNDTLYESGTGTNTVDGGADTDTLAVDYAAAAASIYMVSNPTFDAGGGQSGSIEDSAGTRRTDFTGIENLTLTTGSKNDLVRGLAGQNNIALGEGDDHFVVAGSFNTVDGGGGVDRLTALLGDRTAGVVWNLVTGANNLSSTYTNFEAFYLVTGSGQDAITTANVDANDEVVLGAGDDSVIFWDGDDVVNGGAAIADLSNTGFDTLILNWGAATFAVANTVPIDSFHAGHSGGFSDSYSRSVNFSQIDRFLIAAGSGDDRITTGNGNDEIRTAAGNDRVNGGGGNDLIYGGSGNDALDGGADHDTLDGGAGDDILTGGTGSDIYIVDSARDTVFENAGEGTDEVRTTLASYSLLGANVENLTASSDVAHDFRGNVLNNVIYGAGASDLIRLQDGGDDTAHGGGGNDGFIFGGALSALDYVDGGAGANDQLVIQGDYSALTVLGANVLLNVEVLSILPGSDARFGDASGSSYDYNLKTVNSNIAAGGRLTVDFTNLAAGEDVTFDGSAETDGAFTFGAGFGVDNLTGGSGADLFLFNGGRFGASDRVNGGGGQDELALRGNHTIVFGATAMSNVEVVSILSGQNTRFGVLEGDFTYNLTMNDANVAATQRLVADAGQLTVNETLTFNGAAETDGYFWVAGGFGADFIHGGLGDDLIIGGGSADMLYGGGGNDRFVYRSIAESNAGGQDRIQDFSLGDLLDLSKIDANGALAGDQAFGFIGDNAFAGLGAASAGQLRAVDGGGGLWTVYGDTDGNGSADFQFAVVVTGGHVLGASDFML